MSLIKEMLSAACVAAGVMVLGGAMLLGASAQAARTPGPIIDPGEGGCSGGCNFGNGSCGNVDCSGTGCSCKGGRFDCDCKL